MSRTLEAQRLTNAYQQRAVALRTNAVQQGLGVWAAVGLIGLGELDVVGRLLAGLLTASTATARRMATAHLAGYLSAELDRPVTLPGPAQEPVSLAQPGRPLPGIFATIAVPVALARSYGRSEEDAIAAGRVTSLRRLGVEIDKAGRDELVGAMDDSDMVEGYRMVSSVNGCGACLVANSGELLDPGEDPPDTHPWCRCQPEPSVADVEDNYRRPTGEELFDAMSDDEQDELFSDRGGADKAELLRSGAVPFDALAQPVQMDGANIATERSLEDLQRIAGISG